MSSSSDRALEIGCAITACRVFWGEARFLPGVFTRSTKELASCQKSKPRGHDGSLLLRCGPYIIKVLVEEKEPLGLDLILEKLSTRVVYNLVTD